MGIRNKTHGYMNSGSLNRARICVCTSNRADTEPRAPRHALAIAQSDMHVDVVLFDCSPAGDSGCRLEELRDVPNLSRSTHYFSHRHNGFSRLIRSRARKKLARGLSRVFRLTLENGLSAYMAGVEKKLESIRADVYVAHDISMLGPAGRAAEKNGAALIFDCMEYYSDMGDSQTDADKRIIEMLEATWLPRCDLVLASSDCVAFEYQRKYGIPKPLALYNCPKTVTLLPGPTPSDFRLYWRNSVIGLGQRGLDDAFLALKKLPSEISLHIQGRPPEDRMASINARIHSLGIADRVFTHSPFLPEEAVSAASQFTVGLCLEHSGIRNQELTVSNKIFDYMMAGLPVVASNLPGLAQVIDCSGGGRLYRSGDISDLAEKIYALYSDESLRHDLATKARCFALREGNRDHQMQKFLSAVRETRCFEKSMRFNRKTIKESHRSESYS